MKRILVFSASARRTALAAISLAAFAVLAGCEAPPPEVFTPPQIVNSIVINQPFDTVWAAAVPALGQSFFVINNIAKDSGLINLSYSGSANNMVILNQNLPLCQAASGFDSGVTESCVNGQPTLEGRMNVIFIKVTGQVTRLTVNVRYQLTVNYVDDQSRPLPLQMQFNTGQAGAFTIPELAGIQGVATGNLESSVIQVISSAVPANSVPPPAAPPPSAPVPGQPVRQF